MFRIIKCAFILLLLGQISGCGGSSSSVQNTPPEIVFFVHADTPSLSENNLQIFKDFEAFDADGDPLTYSLVGGDDQNLFEIDTLTGEISFLIAPDYENPMDSNRDNFYIYQVGVSDGKSLTVSFLQTVRVNNVNDIAPIVISPSTFSINENTSNVISVLIDDPDSDPPRYNFVQTYQITNGVDQANFAIDRNSGALSFINPPNFENPTDSDLNNVYLVEISVIDGAFIVPQSIEVTVNDLNEAQFGLNSRPSNTTCVLPDPPDLSPTLELTRVFTNLSFDRPVALRQSPVIADRWYVVEQSGVIRTFQENDQTSTVFADLTSRVATSGNEMGLLGMAFHPNFANNSQVYLYYSTSGGSQNHQSVISKFTATSLTNLDLNSEIEILRFEQPFSNHNGGNILFGPDGYLYIGTGDGGSGGDPQNNSQNNLNLLGKMLRIDVNSSSNGNNYSIPPFNTFVGNEGLDEIYAMGLRNPWRWSFDRLTGDLYAGDVGQNSLEEIDIITSGGNYGWRCYEGSSIFNPTGCGLFVDYDFPIFEYNHSVGFSITGGYVYRGTANPSLYGTYIYTDFGSGPIWGITNPTSANPVNIELGSASFFISSFAEDRDGELYALDFSNGFIYQLTPGSGGGTGTFPDLLSETGCIDSSSPLTMASGLIPYDINAPFWSDGAEKNRWMALADGAEITIEPNGDWTYPPNSVLVKNFELNGRRIETRLLARHADGTWGGYSYEWNDAETDASLVLGGKTIDKQGQSYIFPSTTECFICHTTVAGVTLGLETQQLNKDLIYPSTSLSANQLATLENIGVFTAPLGDIPENLEKLTDPNNYISSLHDRARAYLYSNCSQCHRQNGPTNVGIDFHIETSDMDMNICNQTPIHQMGFATGIMVPGNSFDSSMIRRMNCREGLSSCSNGDEMPPLGSTLVDSAGVNIVSSWINSLASCP